MRVAFITGEYPPMQGGVGAFTREVARSMASLGHQVLVVTRAEAINGHEPGIEVFPLVRQRWNWATIPRIVRWAKEYRPDVINIQFQTAAYNMHPSIHWLPRRLDGTPVVVTFHDLRVPYLFPKAGPARSWVVRKLARDCDAAIATDRADESTLRDHWDILRVCWIPIGSNVSTTPPSGYQRDHWRASLGVLSDELLISYFGFLNESKGGVVLIEALAELVQQGVPAKLIMIGGRAGSSDPTNYAYGQRVDALIDTHLLNGRMHWTGFVEDEEVTAHFLASDMTVLPYRDGVTLRRGTLMAALAHGRAIVTTRAETDVPELSGAVAAVPPDDAKALAGCILNLWKDTARRDSMEQAALRAASYFTWDEIARRTLALYQEIGL